MNASFEESIHYQERLKGNEKAPVCSGCHGAHDVQITSLSTKIKEGCLRCHKDAPQAHTKWLSNPPITLSTFAGTHFNKVACAACHAAEAKRGVYLSLYYNWKSGKPLTEEDLTKLLGTDSAGLQKKMDTNGDGSLDPRELWSLFTRLLPKGVVVTSVGKIDVGSSTEAHRISPKDKAVKECVNCHSSKSDFFKNVYIVIGKTGGKPLMIPAKQDVIGSIYTILPVSKFYAIGSSSIGLLDILFIIALIGGIAVPIGHISLRIITSPIRSLRKMGKGGKK
jgi:hypothetical protein